MKIIKKLWLLLLLQTLPVQAQITPDNTLPTSTTINQQNNIIYIEQGTVKGTNLFHSFTQFSVTEGITAYFNNNTNIQNIFSRVTGSEISQINGTIQANGNANLFLMNPQGIIFGKNASLNLGGSFLATTANSIKFADNFEFMASNQQNNPLLTVTVPVGLQFNQPNSGEITVLGNGNNLDYNYPILSQVQKSSNSGGLKVPKGQNLTLIGGNINLLGGIIEAPEGKIILASINEANFNFNNLDITGSFKNINMTEKSSLETIGNGGGSILILANNINIKDGSLIFVQNTGDKKAGNIDIKSSQLLIDGLDSNNLLRSFINNENIANGFGGNLNINTDKLLVQNGAFIGTFNFGLNQVGDVNIQANDSINVTGYNNVKPENFSLIVSSTYAQGNAGNLNIFSPLINLIDGGALASTTFLNQGNSGNININSKEIFFTGFIPKLDQFSAISTASFSRGNAGNIIINTEKLTLKNQGVITSSLFAQGNAGSININASKSIEITGNSFNTQNILLTQINALINEFNAGNIGANEIIEIARNVLNKQTSLSTGISSSSEIINPELKIRYQIPDLPTGSSSNITLNTTLFSLQNQSVINVSNIFQGNAGTIKIIADSVILNQSAIAGLTVAKEGGNIILEINKFILLRNNSLINANALGNANGGNIRINSPFIIAVPLENSDIIANAFLGKGGNININTQGILGIKYNPILTQFSDINASSQLGLDGIVNINTPGIDPNNGLIQLPSQLIDISGLVANQCNNNNEQNTFTITGRSGLPHNPFESLNDNNSQIDLGDIYHDFNNTNNHGNSIESKLSVPELVEAKRWIINDKNQVVLINDFSSNNNYGFNSKCKSVSSGK